MNIAIIFAGGIGQRLSENKTDIPKQFIEVYDKPIIVHTLENFQNHKEIDKIYISTLSNYKRHMQTLVEKYNLSKVSKIVDGGETAQDSIYNALIVAQQENDENSIVLIHDGVRPIVKENVISQNIEMTKNKGNAITCIPAYETTLISEDKISPKEVPFRKNIFIAQAPQSFILKEIIEAHNQIRKHQEKYENMIDSCTIYHTLGLKTYMVKGHFGNIKVTTPEDLYLIKALLKYNDEKKSVFAQCLEKDKNNDN